MAFAIRLAAVLLPLALAGCSWTNILVVRNETEHPRALRFMQVRGPNSDVPLKDVYMEEDGAARAVELSGVLQLGPGAEARLGFASYWRFVRWTVLDPADDSSIQFGVVEFAERWFLIRITR